MRAWAQPVTALTEIPDSRQGQAETNGRGEGSQRPNDSAARRLPRQCADAEVKCGLPNGGLLRLLEQRGHVILSPNGELQQSWCMLERLERVRRQVVGAVAPHSSDSSGGMIGHDLNHRACRRTSSSV